MGAMRPQKERNRAILLIFETVFPKLRFGKVEEAPLARQNH
jgi:hypothetical protein